MQLQKNKISDSMPKSAIKSFPFSTEKHTQKILFQISLCPHNIAKDVDSMLGVKSEREQKK